MSPLKLVMGSACFSPLPMCSNTNLYTIHFMEFKVLLGCTTLIDGGYNFRERMNKIGFLLKKLEKPAL